MQHLVSTSWLADHLQSGDVIVLDASQHLPGSGRDAAAEFAQGHIAGARFLDLASFIDETSPVPKALPRADQVTERLTALGARNGQSIVLYDDSAIRTAARAWFILRHYGVEASILDGGLAKWRAEGRSVEAGTVQVERGDFAVSAGSGRVRNKAAMLANVAAATEQVIDARDAERFAGTAPPDPHGLAGGHIPGSRNLPYGQLYREDGTFKPVEELRAKFEQAGIDIGAPIVTSCGSGVTASVLLLALAELGHDDAALYDGSWLEWGSDPATPKEMGKPR